MQPETSASVWESVETGYSSNGIPATELLKNVDFIERRAAGEETQVADGASGLRVPGGLPVVTPLDPDKPTGFYGGHSPNEVGAAAWPYIRLMSELMTPGTAISHLFNEKAGTPGGKKASDNGKNDRHGDGGRKAKKTDKQIEKINAQMPTVKSRRQKRALKNKIKRLRRTGQKAQQGEKHSTRGKGTR